MYYLSITSTQRDVNYKENRPSTPALECESSDTTITCEAFDEHLQLISDINRVWTSEMVLYFWIWWCILIYQKQVILMYKRRKKNTL